MGFVAISIKEYIKRHLKNNPKADEKGLTRRLEKALRDFQDGVKCSCGNDIWVIGSASVGTCITGDSYPTEDFEIEDAVKKAANSRSGRYIDDMPHKEFCGFFDDDGYEINPDLVDKPGLCLCCVYNEDPDEEILCVMNRNDQRHKDSFECGAFKGRDI